MMKSVGRHRKIFSTIESTNGDNKQQQQQAIQSPEAEDEPNQINHHLHDRNENNVENNNENKKNKKKKEKETYPNYRPRKEYFLKLQSLEKDGIRIHLVYFLCFKITLWFNFMRKEKMLKIL